MANNTVGDAWIAIRPDPSGFESALTGGLAGPLKKAEGMFSSSFAKVAGVIGVGFGIGEGVNLIRESIGAAEDLQTAQRNVQQVFGTSAAAVVQYSDSSVKSLGLTKSAALDAAGTLGRMFEGLGVGQQQAASDVTSLQGRIADLASATGKSQDEVTSAVEAGLRGRGMALKNFGIDISTTTLAQEALKLGLISTAGVSADYKVKLEKQSIAQQTYNDAVKKHGENSLQAQRALVTYQGAQEAVNKATDAALPKLDDAAKAQAAYGLIMADTTNTAGDFGNTATDKMAQFKAAIGNAKEALGTALLPTLERFTDWAATHESDIEHFAKAVGDGLGTAADDLGKLFGFLSEHKDQALAVVEALGGLYGAGKVKSAVGSVIGDLKDLFKVGGLISQGVTLLTGLGGGSRGTSIPGLGVQHVWVDNPGFGGPGAGGEPVPLAAPEAGIGATLLGGLGFLLGPGGLAFMQQAGNSPTQLPFTMGDQQQFGGLVTSDLLDSNTWASAGRNMTRIFEGHEDPMKLALDGNVKALQQMENDAKAGGIVTYQMRQQLGILAAVVEAKGPLTAQQFQQVSDLWDQGYHDSAAVVLHMGPLADAVKHIGGHLNDALTPAQQMVADFWLVNEHVDAMDRGALAVGRAIGVPAPARTLAQRIADTATKADIVNGAFDTLIGHLNWVNSGAAAVGAALHSSNAPGGSTWDAIINHLSVQP